MYKIFCFLNFPLGGLDSMFQMAKNSLRIIDQGVKVLTELSITERLPLPQQSSPPRTIKDITIPMRSVKKLPCMSDTDTMAVGLIPPRAVAVHSFSGGQ